MTKTQELEVVAWAYRGPKRGLIATEEKPAHAPEARALVDLADLVSAQDELDSLKTQLHLKSGILELELDARRKAEAERDALRDVLGNMRCPRPCNHRPDEFDAKDCVSAGECGCGAANLSGGLNAPS